MADNELQQFLDEIEDQLIELERMISEPVGQFSKSNIENMFRENTAEACENGQVVLYQAIKEVETKVNGLTGVESSFPSEPLIGDIKQRYARCGYHLVTMINMIDEWD